MKFFDRFSALLFNLCILLLSVLVPVLIVASTPAFYQARFRETEIYSTTQGTATYYKVIRYVGGDSDQYATFTDEQYDGMREIGKFAFGVHYNENEIDEAKAIQTAIDAVTDGLVRVFKGNDEITDLDAEIEISEGDVFTFVRLTMLSGRMW